MLSLDLHSFKFMSTFVGKLGLSSAKPMKWGSNAFNGI